MLIRDFYDVLLFELVTKLFPLEKVHTLIWPSSSNLRSLI